MPEAIRIFLSFFEHPNLFGISISISIGIIWLLIYKIPVIKYRRFWIFPILSGLLGLVGLAFIQYPLNQLLGIFLKNFWTEVELQQNILIIGLLSVLIGGFSQEITKIIPFVIYRIFKKDEITSINGLILGAVAGAGFGVFEAQWMLNNLFNAGWTWTAVSENGVLALIPFWERFFAIGGHIAFSAIAGYGIAKGKGWRFLMLSALMHAALNYSAYLLKVGILTFIHVEILIAVFTIGLTIAILSKENRNRFVKNPGENDYV